MSKSKKKNIKVRDLNPKKDAKGGSVVQKAQQGTAYSGTHIQGAAQSGTALQGTGKSLN
jgi:hypothetical protein